MLLAMLQVFNIIPHRYVALWDAIILAYAIRGHAIVHTALVNEGCKYFRRMSHDYGIKPIVAHYACMVDLLGRYECLRRHNTLST